MTPDEFQKWIESAEYEEAAENERSAIRYFQQRAMPGLLQIGHVATTQKPPTDFTFPGERPNDPNVIARKAAYENAVARGLVKTFPARR